jgi:hypothetical protein
MHKIPTHFRTKKILTVIPTDPSDCQNDLLLKLTDKNAIEYLAASLKVNAEYLKNAAVRLITTKAKPLLYNPEFKQAISGNRPLHETLIRC